MNSDKKVDGKILKTNKKWCQLKKKQQIVVSDILRDRYIDFVLTKGKKPNKDEKEFLLACAHLKIQENDIWISENEARKYFHSKIPKYDISVEKLKAQQ